MSKEKKKKSLKKKMFRSNMMILLLALVSLVLVVLLVLGLFWGAFERRLDTMEYTNELLSGDDMQNVWITGQEELSEEFEQELKDWAKQTLLQMFLLLILAIVLICGCAIGVLLLLSSIFTKRMLKLVMEPLDQLTAGAERIQAGNLEEAIDYHGEEEFERVCGAFNMMQATILADMEQQKRNEKARTDMVTGISHDLRTPLTSIQGYIKGVLDGVAATEDKRNLYLQTAYEATEEMNVLLQKLFEFSRVESGQMPFSLVPVDLGEFTQTYLAQKEALCVKEQVTFSYTRDDDLPEAEIDVEQMRRVFDNLLENSMKYSGVTPVEILVSCERQQKSVVLTWRDRGAGVPEEKLPHIFERFYRCDESRNKKGSGVGLYVVKYIMERQGGTVTAENDGGLKLTLYFPISEEKKPEPGMNEK